MSEPMEHGMQRSWRQTCGAILTPSPQTSCHTEDVSLSDISRPYLRAQRETGGGAQLPRIHPMWILFIARLLLPKQASQSARLEPVALEPPSLPSNLEMKKKHHF